MLEGFENWNSLSIAILNLLNTKEVAFMGGNRTLLIVLLVVIVIGGIGGGAFLFLQQKGEETPIVEETPPIEFTEIVVALQNIPRGMRISYQDKAIELQSWPNEHLPVAYYTDPAEIDDKFARMDIPRGMPVFPNMVSQPGGMLASEGSAAALFSPTDRVAYALPMDVQGGVAWAIRPGDHVDVIAALQLVSVDDEFQTTLPNNFIGLPEGPEDTSGTLSGIYGRFETLPNGQPAMVYPSGQMIPSLVVQLTVQDAIVWHLGIWEDAEQKAAAAAAAAAATEDDGAGGLLGGAETVATPPPQLVEFGDIEPVTLLVKREDVLVLKYLQEMGADLDLVLRPAGYNEAVLQTQPVWLRYIVDKYQLPNTAPDLPVAPKEIRTPLALESIEQTPEGQE